MMNKFIKQISFLFSVLLIMVSCNEDPEYFTLEAPADQMKVAASEENLTLEKINEADEVITFTWNKATDRGAGTKIVYYFRLYHAEMKDLESELIQVEKDTYSLSFTGRELNNMLAAWDVIPGDEATIEAEVLAVVEVSPEYMKPEISKTQFNVIGYDASNKLYLTAEVDNQKRYIEMNMVGDGVYSWKGELSPCNFWFIRNIDKGFPAYLKGGDDASLIYSPTGEGDSFTADRLGVYDIIVDLNSLTLTVSMTPINRLYLVTVKDGVERVTALSEAEVSSDIFYLKDVFEEGTEFRFVRTQDALWPAYVPGANSAVLELKDDGADMFKVTKTATYVMTVNMTDLSLIFLDIYVSPTGVVGVVGDAASDVGWDAGRAVTNGQLTQKDLKNRPEVISYTGYFVCQSGAENAFKLLFENGWGSGLWAAKANSNPFNPDEQAASTNGDGDKKWVLPTGTQSGTYTLELNLHTMKVSLVK